MHVIDVRNVAEALPRGVEHLMLHGQQENSRAGPVLVAPGPVTTVYRRPTERVLHSAVRDANPFFHLAESLWMLAGRDDAKFLNNFVSDFGARFAESASGRENWEAGGRVHGAYGHRWRVAHGIDQLEYVISKLTREPLTRQCVIQMWDCGQRPSREMSYGSDDLMGEWRDRPCNTHAYLRVRRSAPDAMHEWELDVTVCCRSNDAIWGAYGANAVHFSVLQEYLAAHLGCGVGRYYQVSNNFHVYLSEIDRLKKRVDEKDLPLALRDDRYVQGCRATRLIDNPRTFDDEVVYVLAAYESGAELDHQLHNAFLQHTVWPALMAHRAHKQKLHDSADAWLNQISGRDWRVACEEWVLRRRRR